MEGWNDLVDGFFEYTDGIPSPASFRLWAGISAVGAALERRLWIESSGGPLYATMYIMLVGKPGVGKSQSIDITSSMWRATKELKLASDSVTRASLIDEINAAKRTMVLSSSQLVEYHSLQIAASEFGVLVPAHDLEFLSTLTALYDNRVSHGESRRTGDRRINAVNPQVNMLAGAQPSYLAALLPEEAWGMGFMTRVIMVHSSQKVRTKFLSNKRADKRDKFNELVMQLKSLLKIHGEVKFEQEAEDALETWIEAGCPPEPEHSRLEGYNTRRNIHVARLCIISAASAGHPLIITLNDFYRATNWLIQAEQTMPDIFKEMVQRSDRQVLDELHMFAWGLWVKDRKPIHEARLIYFLGSKVPSDKIHRLLDIAVRSNMLDKAADLPLYRPRPKSDHGVE